MPDAASLSDDRHDVVIAASDTVYTGAVWNIQRETFDYNGSPIVREFVSHPGAVAVVAHDDEGRILLIKQYRHPVRSRDWELPAGLRDIPGEDTLVAAQRELAEEADLQAAVWEPLLTIDTSPGGSDESIEIFHATQVSATPSAFDREAEEADIEVRWVALDEVVASILAGGLHNSITAVAVLALHAKLAR